MAFKSPTERDRQIFIMHEDLRDQGIKQLLINRKIADRFGDLSPSAISRIVEREKLRVRIEELEAENAQLKEQLDQ